MRMMMRRRMIMMMMMMNCTGLYCDGKRFNEDDDKV
jgi:hypothetical protein